MIRIVPKLVTAVVVRFRYFHPYAPRVRQLMADYSERKEHSKEIASLSVIGSAHGACIGRAHVPEVALGRWYCEVGVRPLEGGLERIQVVLTTAVRTACVHRSPLSSLTLAISCEAVPASEMVRRGHEPALLPRNGAGESFVSFIALLGGVPHLPDARNQTRAHALSIDPVAWQFIHEGRVLEPRAHHQHDYQEQ